MSGTSLDGVDGVIADFSGDRPAVLAHISAGLPTELRSELLALNSSGPNELHRAALAANGLTRVYAQVVDRLLQKTKTTAAAVRAIGAHGQTVRHRPQEFDGTGYTLQLNQPALLAELTGIDVVADFRSRDVAAGGQGAPLVPPFHSAFFGLSNQCRAVLNIGGISNITILDTHEAQALIGFDCGPGNALMDAWCQEHIGTPYDDEGRWGAQGMVQAPLLTKLLAEPFFAKPAPKSTGRDLFNRPWLDAALADLPTYAPCDVQATLTELTAIASAQSIPNHCNALIVCGGGALNHLLMARLTNALPHCHVSSSSSFGLPPLQVEATAFAWLARQTVTKQTANNPSVTGAKGSRILGAIYAA